MKNLYAGAISRPSSISHPPRPSTVGIVIHWTAGYKAGDLATLDGPNVDCQFYVSKLGEVYQFLDMDSQGWHAFHMGNTYCIGIEHESFGEKYTDKQLLASQRLVGYLCKRYGIPIRHVDPSGDDLSTFHGIFGHRDLSIGGVRVDGNDHTDTVPSDTGWTVYLDGIKGFRSLPPISGHPGIPDYSSVPFPNSLRLAIGGRLYAGPDDCAGAIRWCAANEIKDAKAAISFRGKNAAAASVWRGPVDVRNVCKNLAATYFAK